MSEKGTPRPRRRPPTAVECALAVVAAGLAVASAMLALAGTAAAGLALDSANAPYIQDAPVSVSGAGAAPTVVPADSPYPLRLATAAPTASPATVTPSPTSTPPPPFMPMPVEGVWRVICGYRCGLHDEEHNSTFALDIALDEGETAGQPVRSPIQGRIVAVTDESIYVCRGKEVEGAEAGAVIVIDFRPPSGPALRLRLVHVDPASVPDELRPNGKPVPVEAGTLLGAVASMDRCSHLHISLAHLERRQEIPEPLVIEGTPLADCEGDNCWLDALLPPQDR